MIQRIQSFYLILAVCALAVCFMFPVATYNIMGNGEAEPQIVSQLFLLSNRSQDAETSVLAQIESGCTANIPQRGFIHIWPLSVVAAVAAVLALVSIFMYKNRMRQVRVVACGFLLNLVYLFLLFIWAVDAYGDAIFQLTSPLLSDPHLDTTFSVGTWASVVSLLFLFLSQRAIKRDEAKVRAADRLR